MQLLEQGWLPSNLRQADWGFMALLRLPDIRTDINFPSSSAPGHVITSKKEAGKLSGSQRLFPDQHLLIKAPSPPIEHDWSMILALLTYCYHVLSNVFKPGGGWGMILEPWYQSQVVVVIYRRSMHTWAWMQEHIDNDYKFSFHLVKQRRK